MKTIEPKYTTFLRSARNWQEFASAEKMIQETNLTIGEAKEACANFNNHLSDAEKENGTKMEFTLDENI